MPVGERAVIGRPERIFAAVAVSGCVVLAGADLSVTGFHVLFTQDDPYIHLALAQRLLASGHYGLNEGEVAAPASSILYPFLLAPLLALGLGPAAALLINVLVAGATGALLCGALREGGYNVDRMRSAALASIAFGWMVGFNVFAVALTGMENLLAAALALAILLGLAALWRHDRLRWFLPFCAMLLPLVRYEGVGLWLICVLSLMLRRRFWAACATFAPAALALGGFSLFLLHNGLPPLPSSVLSKASSGSFGSHSAAGNALAIVVNNMRGNFSGADAWPLLALIAGNLAVLCVKRLRRAPGAAPLALTGAAICLAHVLAGKFGGFGRYQAYAEIFGAMTVLLGFSGMLAPRIERGPAWAVALLAMAPVLLFPESILYALAPPLAAQNLYSQQYQLHRFITAFWRAPAGANDIGEVSYDNPYYLLDYAGLGSEAARLAHATATDPEWMNRLARGHGVEFAMLFPRWFPAVPANWRPVADLHLDMVNVIAGDPVVRFYAITPEAASRAAPLLQQFAAGLPPAAHLSIAGTKPEIKDVK